MLLHVVGLNIWCGNAMCFVSNNMRQQVAPGRATLLPGLQWFARLCQAVLLSTLIVPSSSLQDNTTYVHVTEWADARTKLQSVGILLQSSTGAPSPLQPPALSVRNCLVAATNNTLVPDLLRAAAIVTPQPLLVYLTTNVSIGVAPALPATGIQIGRPVVFVGLWSAVTSINFQMVVNQLNASVSPYSNVTFVGVVLENLATGDSVTSAIAAPFSITIENNVWAVYYNRCVAV